MNTISGTVALILLFSNILNFDIYQLTKSAQRTLAGIEIVHMIRKGDSVALILLFLNILNLTFALKHLKGLAVWVGKKRAILRQLS
ncbi:MAG: hypothetical protein HRT68_13165 [Flavobacteriaceae bacterium]|nr:hypothetical protein [Flavobacteriaceae bacterium]